MKRIICAVMAVILLLGVVSVASIDTHAASNMKTSEECIAVLKLMEGFTKYPVQDSGQKSVGYGCRCPDDKYEQWSVNGITEAEADALMREYLAGMEYSVNNFIDQNGLTLTQGQFDAIMSFTYNLGTSWLTKTSSTMRSAVLNGATGNDLLFAMSQYCRANGQLLTGLVLRRLKEANMYLNGQYSNYAPSNYTYVVYNAVGGTTSALAQAYDMNQPVAPMPVPTYEGHVFLGWYTAPEGGTKVTVLDQSTSRQTLYAQWEASDNASVSGVVETLVAYNRTTARDVNVYDVPCGVTVVDTIAKGETVRIVGEYVDADGYLWCHIENGGWVKYIDTQTSFGYELESAVTVVVTGSSVNVRKGPGTNYGIVTKVTRGKELVITTTARSTNTGTPWGKFELSGQQVWICLDYTNYDEVANPQPPVTEPPVTEPPVTEPPVTEPPVTEPEDDKDDDVTNNGGAEDGATDDDKTDSGDQNADNNGGGLEGGDSSDNKSETSSQRFLGIINVNQFLRIRADAGTSYPVLGYLGKGDQVEILEQKLVGSVTWGRIEQGWISMQYVNLIESDDKTDQETDKEEETVKPATITGIVKVNQFLRIRAGAGTNFAEIGRLGKDDRVEILEQKKVGSVTWGRIEQGWISMDYIQIVQSGGSATAPDNSTGNVGGTENTTPSAMTGTIVAQNSLRIRAGAGTSYGVVGYLARGVRVTILEIKTVGTSSWGRVEQGWISMSLVQLDSGSTSGSGTNSGNTATDTAKRSGTVTAGSLWVRSGPGSSYSAVGIVTKGTVVEILETQEVNGRTWARTAKGWISMAYVQ